MQRPAHATPRSILGGSSYRQLPPPSFLERSPLSARDIAKCPMLPCHLSAGTDCPASARPGRAGRTAPSVTGAPGSVGRRSPRWAGRRTSPVGGTGSSEPMAALPGLFRCPRALCRCADIWGPGYKQPAARERAGKRRQGGSALARAPHLVSGSSRCCTVWGLFLVALARNVPPAPEARGWGEVSAQEKPSF